MAVRTLTRSFGGGEITPEFFGRLGDAKFQTGVAVCRNFIVLPHGPAANRPGTKFVRATPTLGAVHSFDTSAARLIPFTYSTTQTYSIEIGVAGTTNAGVTPTRQYIRFHTQGSTLLVGSPAAWSGATAYVEGDLVSSGGTNYYCILAHTNHAPPNTTYWYAEPSDGVYEIPHPYAYSDLMDLHYTQSNDVLTITHQGYTPRELRRNGATDWTLDVIDFTPDITAPSNVIASTYATGLGHTLQNYKVTSVAGDDSESQVSAPAVDTVPVTISSITQANPGVLTTAWDHHLSVGDQVIVQNALGMTAINGTNYTVNTVPSATTLTLAVSGVAVNTSGYGAYTASSGWIRPLIGVKNNLLTSGNYNTISWDANADAVRYNVYKQNNGFFGYIGQTDQTTFKDDNIAPDMLRTPPINRDPFNATGHYPAGVGYYEQRRVFAGTLVRPQKIWMTQPGTESNMDYHIPTRDDDAIAIVVAAREANTILHVLPLLDLFLLTSAAEWRVSTLTTDVITPSSISVKPLSSVGAANAQPVVVNANAIYATARGGHMRELALSQTNGGGYYTVDISLRAPHLFDGHTIKDFAYSKAPYSIVWAVSSSGKLIGLTYIPEEQVSAFHRHDSYTLAGESIFESVTSVAEGVEDAVYAVVQREINGARVRYIERMGGRMIDPDAPQDAFFVDCGATYDDGTANITGITRANPAVVTLDASTRYSNGDLIEINDVEGMTEVNTRRFKVANRSGFTFQLHDEFGNAVNSSGYTAYTSGGTTQKAVTTVSGLSHLEGETVSILADAAVEPQQTVTSGTITLQHATKVIQIGLPITADIQTLPLALEAAAAGAQGSQKNINKAWFRVFASSGLSAGPSFDKLTEAKWRTTEVYGTPPALRTGMIPVVVSPSWGDDAQLCLRQSDPLPLTVVALVLESSIGS